VEVASSNLVIRSIENRPLAAGSRRFRGGSVCGGGAWLWS
jgi:hypothetical protein